MHDGAERVLTQGKNPALQRDRPRLELCELWA